MEKQTIAIVDDDHLCTLMTQFFVERQGFAPVTFRNAGYFLRWLANHEPCCVLLDLDMPQFDGFETLRRLGEKNCAFPVIVVSAHLDAANASKLMQLGVQEMVTKPIDGDDLVAKINLALARRKAA